jgi:hypothetical protein
MDKRKHPKKGFVIPGLKRRHPCRVPSMNMHNEHTAYIEALIVENQQLKDRVKALEKEMSSNEEAILASPTAAYVDQHLGPIKEDLERLKEIHHTH